MKYKEPIPNFPFCTFALNKIRYNGIIKAVSKKTYKIYYFPDDPKTTNFWADNGKIIEVNKSNVELWN